MDIKELLARCDHTLLAVTAEESEIETLCDEAVKYGCASVCIPPSYVKKASAYLKGKGSSLAVCTVIGFPNGYNTTKVKVYETEQAVLDGASEIDMVEETNHYYPFGGAFASTSNVQPYKYNGKELDSKKGLNWYDYGARHYDAALGRFTTNDRFAEKYYSMSPYQYGANNPVNNIDVNGDTIVVNPNPNGLIDNVRIFFGFDTKYQKDVKADLQQLKKDDKEIGEMIIELEKSKNVHSITRTKRGKSNSSGFDREKAKKDIPQGSIINYDPDVKTDINGNHRTPRIGLSHELQHSSDVDKGIMSYENIGNGIPMREIRAINTENKIRKRTGDAKRTEYRGRKIPQKLLE